MNKFYFIHGTLLLTLFLCVKSMDSSMNNNEITINNTFEVPLPHTKLYFLPNNRLLGIGIGGYNVLLWNLKRDKIDKKFPLIIHNSFSRINQSSLNKSKELIAVVASYKNKIELFNTKTWQLIKSFENEDLLSAMLFSPTNKKVLTTTGYLKKITFWNIITGKIIKEVEDIHDTQAYLLQFSPDGKKIAAGFLEKIKLWDVESKNLLNCLDFSKSIRIDFSFYGKEIITTSQFFDKIVLWDTETLKQTMYNSKDSILIYKKKGIFNIPLEKTINLKNTDLTAVADSRKYIAISGNNCFVIVLKLPKNIKEQL